MKSSIAALAILATVFTSTLVAAEETDRQYRITGPGATECFNYLDAPLDGKPDAMFMSWAQGFVTYHLLDKDMALSRDEISNDFLRRNINKFCEANPTKDFYAAVMDHLIILNSMTKTE